MKQNNVFPFRDLFLQLSASSGSNKPASKSSKRRTGKSRILKVPKSSVLLQKGGKAFVGTHETPDDLVVMRRRERSLGAVGTYV
jgi:hypothetical protein